MLRFFIHSNLPKYHAFGNHPIIRYLWTIWVKSKQIVENLYQIAPFLHRSGGMNYDHELHVLR
jgi:hypothetical protein